MDSSNTYNNEGRSGLNDEAPRSSLNHFLRLPDALTANILCRLGAYEILKSASRVCSSWRNICRDPSMWRFIDMKNLGDYAYLGYMCEVAVCRSQGQLTQLYIDHFATDALLYYISTRSSKLKCLQIRGYYDFDEGLEYLVKQSPLLEELHLVCDFTDKPSIETIGQSCPKLKSFTLSLLDNSYENVHALAIAKSMPSLCHLRLVGSSMTNEGLHAILDGCPKLESLDIRGCFIVDLCGEIGDRIAQTIKDFKSPDDPIEGCDWDADIFFENYSD